MLPSTLSPFPLKGIEEIDLEMLDFGVFSELAILEWFLTCRFNTFSVGMYFQSYLYHLIMFWILVA